MTCTHYRRQHEIATSAYTAGHEDGFIEGYTKGRDHADLTTSNSREAEGIQERLTPAEQMRQSMEHTRTAECCNSRQLPTT